MIHLADDLDRTPWGRFEPWSDWRPEDGWDVGDEALPDDDSEDE